MRDREVSCVAPGSRGKTMSPTISRIAWILVTCCTLFPSISTATTVQVSGHVTDATTGQPVANADVNIWESFPDQNFNQHAFTDSNGYYQLGVPGGYAHFNVSAASYVTQDQLIVHIDTNPVSQDFSLASAGSISGKIHAATAGDPALANATVSLLDADSKSTIAQTTSAGDGSYSFADLAPGTYGVCVIDPTDIYIDSCYNGNDIPADGSITLTTLDLTAGGGFSGIDLSLQVGAVMSGTLSDSYFGGPIADTPIEFTLYSPQGTQVAAVTTNTDAQGGFTLVGLAAGSYYLEAGAHFISGSQNSAYTLRLYGGGECALPSGQSPSCPFATATQVVVPTGGVTGVDFDLFPGYVVKGRVTDANTGAGIPNATINVCDNPSIFLYGVSGTATTDANGDYTIGHAVGAHTYISATNAPGYLSVIWPSTSTQPSDGCLGPEKSAAQQLDFTVPDQVLTGVDFGLQTGASISGTVTASDLPGNLIEANLWLYLSDGQGGTTWVATLRSDVNGYFQTPGVQPGTYYIAAYYDNGADCQMYSAATCGTWNPTDPLSLDFSAATPVPLTSGQAQTGVALQLKGDVFHSSFDN